MIRNLTAVLLLFICLVGLGITPFSVRLTPANTTIYTISNEYPEAPYLWLYTVYNGQKSACYFSRNQSRIPVDLPCSTTHRVGTEYRLMFLNRQPAGSWPTQSEIVADLGPVRLEAPPTYVIFLPVVEN